MRQNFAARSHHPFLPTSGTELYWILTAYAHEAFQPLGLGRHHLISIPATRPHTLHGHDVYWIVRRETDTTITPMTHNQGAEIARDRDFLDGIEGLVGHERQIRPQLRAYMVLGYRDPAVEIDASVSYSHGLQSQPYLHFHLVEPCDHEPHAGVLTPANEEDLSRLRIFGNSAGEWSILAYERDLAQFGERFVYYQPVGRIGKYDQMLERTMFGFGSFARAFRQTLELQRRISQQTWQAHLVYLASQKVVFAGTALSLFQAPVPSFAIILPSKEDQTLGSVKQDFAAWVMPLTVVGPPNTLTLGGAFYRPNHVSGNHQR